MEILIFYGENVLTSYYQSNTYENYNNFQSVSNHDHVLAMKENGKLVLFFLKEYNIETVFINSNSIIIFDAQIF